MAKIKHTCPYCKQQQDSIATAEEIQNKHKGGTSSKIADGDPSICFNCCKVAVYVNGADEPLREITEEDVKRYALQPGFLEVLRGAILGLPAYKTKEKADSMAHMTLLILKTKINLKDDKSIASIMEDTPYKRSKEIFDTLHNALYGKPDHL